MKFARIIGRVTLSVSDVSYKGARLLIGLPTVPERAHYEREAPLGSGNSLVIYDKLGAGEGDLVAYTDGGEASAPFEKPTPCDAYVAAIVEQINWQPLKQGA